MKNIQQIFDEQFKSMNTFLTQQKIYSCKYIANELTIVSFLADFKEGIFISETLLNIFEDTEEVLPRNHKIQSKLFTQLRQQLNELAKIYKGDDIKKKYTILSDMRNIVTQYQHNAYLIPHHDTLTKIEEVQK